MLFLRFVIIRKIDAMCKCKFLVQFHYTSHVCKAILTWKPLKSVNNLFAFFLLCTPVFDCLGCLILTNKARIERICLILYCIFTAARLAQWDKRRSAERESVGWNPGRTNTSTMKLEPSTMFHADSVLFLTSTSNDRIQKYSSMFGFLWTNPLVNSQRYIRNVCSAMA